MRAVICGYYGYGNGGDEALLRTLIRQMPQDWQPLVFSGDPPATQALHGIPGITRLQALAVLWRERGVFIWGGGSLIQDRTSWRSPLVYLGLMGLAQQRQWQTLAWAQGIGPITRPWIRALTQRSFAGCDAVSVRDPDSAKQLDAWGIPYVIAPDPVWALPPEPVPPISDAPCVAVIFRPHPQLTPPRLDVLTEALYHFQRQTTAQILLMPMQIPQDLPLAETVQARIPGSRVITLRDPQILMGTLAQVHLTLSMRYHGLVMAASTGSRCFGLSYDPKVRTFLNSLGLPGWDLEAIPRDPQVIAQAWFESFQGSPYPLRQQWQQEAQRHGDLLAGWGAAQDPA